MKDEKKKPAAYNVLMHRLPIPNFHLLRALSNYLITVVNNSEVNKMDIRNIGIVFSPTLNIPTPVILMFLTEFESIFGNPVKDANVPALEVAQSQSLTPEDIRSPRQQIFSSLPTPSYNQASFGSNQQLSRHDLVSNGFHGDREIGFAPLQPAYDSAPISIPYDQTRQPDSITVPDPEYAVARPGNLAPGDSAKQRRRESSMLLVGGGERKRSSSSSMMRVGEGVYRMGGCPDSEKKLADWKSRHHVTRERLR